MFVNFLCWGVGGAILVAEYDVVEVVEVAFLCPKLFEEAMLEQVQVQVGDCQ